MSKHTALWVEYQARRADFVQIWQQSLARVGIMVNFEKGISVMAGCAYTVTYPYGEYPAGPNNLPEKRIFEQVSWSNLRGRVKLDHRLRLEQRFLGQVDQASPDGKVIGWTYVNRIRYNLKISIPINKPKLGPKTWYFTTHDEIFIGFGKNVNQNVFDQNRLIASFGYQFNKMFQLEAGCINQVLQQISLVNGQQVYQYNTGPLVSLYFTLK